MPGNRIGAVLFFLAAAVPPGYRVELVASEPLVQDPVMIDWDGDGRMWVVEMPGYMPDINAKGEHAPASPQSNRRSQARMDARRTGADQVTRLGQKNISDTTKA